VRLAPFDVTLGANPADAWSLEAKAGASTEQAAHLRSWLQD
jgi:hypothetical protein